MHSIVSNHIARNTFLITHNCGVLHTKIGPDRVTRKDIFPCAPSTPIGQHGRFVVVRNPEASVSSCRIPVTVNRKRGVYSPACYRARHVRGRA